MEVYIKQNICLIMKQKSIKTTDLSQKSGISKRTIADLLNMGKREYNPRLSTLYAIANALEINLLYLFVREEEVPMLSENDRSQNEYLQILIGNFSRATLGKKHKEISVDPGLSETTISRLLSGKMVNPKLSTIETISEVTGISISDLLTRGGNDK